MHFVIAAPSSHVSDDDRGDGETSRRVSVGDGLRSGRGPVAEFLVGAAALSTARFHRLSFSLRSSEEGRTGEGDWASARSL
jgi:hypothetical protein